MTMILLCFSSFSPFFFFRSTMVYPVLLLVVALVQGYPTQASPEGAALVQGYPTQGSPEGAALVQGYPTQGSPQGEDLDQDRIRPDQINMAMLFCNLVKRDLSGVRYVSTL